MKKFYFLFMVAILLMSCATFAPSITPTPSLIPTGVTPNPLPEPTDPTQVMVVKTNETFDIVLPSNPSTGYRWQIIAQDANLVQSIEQTYIAGQPVMPGSGGMDVWTFTALAPGETTVQFGYFSPGNTMQPEETVIFTVRIE